MKKLLSFLAIPFLLALSLSIAPCSVLRAETEQADITVLVQKMDSLLSKVNELAEKNANLQKEVDALRKENRQLRDALTSSSQKTTPTETTSVRSDENTTFKISPSGSSQTTYSNQQQTKNLSDETYWLNTNRGSNVRHNSSCKWYRNTKKGRPCTKDEGRACGICGG